jgi:hypothetical protein
VHVCGACERSKLPHGDFIRKDATHVRSNAIQFILHRKCTWRLVGKYNVVERHLLPLSGADGLDCSLQSETVRSTLREKCSRCREVEHPS